MKEMINKALEGYDDLKEEVDENPENARDGFLDILNHSMWSAIGQDFSDMSEKVENLDLDKEEDVEEFKDLVDKMKSMVEV